ncbi:hypothetical protein E2C01_098065 [Portunus trituberculatus]|uniref:Uncharacterized protein n=1 Tax=Portunus trituberculatus TaxID=210409 RepID=A0A5B7KBX3_PORTR|nr:hypothetical protein [Portunus trituberculatus]
MLTYRSLTTLTLHAPRTVKSTCPPSPIPFSRSLPLPSPVHHLAIPCHPLATSLPNPRRSPFAGHHASASPPAPRPRSPRPFPRLAFSHPRCPFPCRP